MDFSLQNIAHPNILDIIKKLSTPRKIQEFLNIHIGYNHKDTYRSVHGVIHHKEADCFEGSIFAYVCLYLWGFDPKIVVIEAVNDVDHLITTYQYQGLHGSIAMSRCEDIKDRIPVFKTLPDLAMSYYPYYTSIYPEFEGQLTMVGYSDPIDLVEKFGTQWFGLPGDNALEYLYNHFTDNIMCTNIHTNTRYLFPPEE